MGTKRLMIFIGSVLILIIILMIPFIQENNDTEDNREFNWSIYRYPDSTYVLTFEDGPSMTLKNLQFRLVDKAGETVSIIDESGESILINGTLDEIVYDHLHLHSMVDDSTEYGWVNSTYGSFYADYPNGSDNRTLFILFSEYDWDGKLDRPKYDKSDEWWSTEGITIRSVFNGGPADEGHRLLLSDVRTDEILSDIVLPRPWMPLKWSSGLDDGNYHIQIKDIDPIPIDDVGFELKTERPYFIYSITENGKSMEFRGGLNNILWNQSEYWLALNSTWPNSTYNDTFYSDPTGDDNRTLHVVYKDEDNDNNLSGGDSIWFRSEENGGKLNDLFRFSLFDDRDGPWNYNHLRLGFMQLEEQDYRLEYDIGIINETYVINITDITRVISIDLRFTAFDMNGSIVNYGENATLFRNRFESILFDFDEFMAVKNESENLTFGDRFYVSDHEETFYIVFEDVDDDWYISIGDRIWVRSASQGGVISSGFKIRIWEERFMFSTIFTTIKIP